ncbi:hypothetical protein [Candidatus Uabimicrobium sp. HlEnr_7]|uniref:hypothetical protein n=1 Tax=Candidatus Uabimicrobium helgolandensis TaxID=3095367 RepID=UPI003558BC6B
MDKIEIYIKGGDKEVAKLEGQEVHILCTCGMNGITDKGLESISKIIGLRELDLEWAERITDEGLKQLHKIKTLEYVDLEFCEKITVDGLLKLKNALPTCKIEGFS